MSSGEQIHECKNLSLYCNRYAFIKSRNDFLNGTQERISYEILKKIRSTVVNTTIDHIKKRRDDLKEKLKDKVILDLNSN